MLPKEVLDTFPDDLKSEPALVDVEDVPALAKRFVDNHKMVGGMTRIPTKDDDDEALERFYTKMRPESADKYEVKRPDLSEGVQWNDELEGNFKTFAHKNGLTQRQMQTTVDWWMESMGNMRGAHVKTVEEGEAALQKAWGGEYKTHKENMVRGFKAMNDPELAAFLESSGMGNHPSIANVFRQLGEFTQEDHAGASGPSEDQVLTAKEKITSIHNDNCMTKAEKDRCAYHRGDKVATAEMNQRYEIAFPNG